MRLVILLFFCMTLLLGCSDKEVLYPEAYVNYIEDPSNGLRQEKKIGEMLYILQYKPVEYMALREQKGDEVSDTEFKKRVSEMTDIQCYTLRLMAANRSSDVGMLGLSSPAEANARNAYMSFDMQNDIYLVDGKDTLGCGIYHYVNNYGLAPYADFVLAFDSKVNPGKEDKAFVFEDNIFGGGAVNFIIRNKDIQNIPTLKTL